MRLSVFVTALALLAGLAALAAEPANPGAGTILRVPKLAQPPVIDGTIGENEWRGAAAITGFTKYGSPGMSLPAKLQPVWYVAYDDTCFYLAFRYPVNPAGSLRALAKTQAAAESQFWNQSISVDDHTEIEICTIGREKAISGHFYKLMTNPWDVVSDQKIRKSVGQNGSEFNAGARVKSTHGADFWVQEIAIPLKSLELAALRDGDTWVMQLVSAQDPANNYYAWVAASWLQFHLFPELVFDSQAAAVQFAGVGDWMNGNPDFQFRLAAPAAKPVTLKIDVAIDSPAGDSLLRETREIALQAGESKTAAIAAQGLKLGEAQGKRTNTVRLSVTDAATGAVYYRHGLELWREDSKEVQGYLANLAQARRPAQPKLEFAYLPSYNRLIVNADAGILGIDPAIGRNARYLAASFGPEAGGVLGKNVAPLAADGTAMLRFEFPPLAEGNYCIAMELQDASGKALASRNETFTRRVFPFESFTGGKADTVIRPYTPIAATPGGFATIGQNVTLAPNGLVAQFVNRLLPAEAVPALLAAPMQLTLRQGETSVPMTASGTGFAWAPGSSPTHVTGRADNQAGDLGVKLEVTADYTGQYLASVELRPRGCTVVDTLELSIPIAGRVDVAYSYDPRDSILLYRNDRPYAGTPQPGLLWTNLSDRPVRPHAMFVGNGDRGLYWYTDSYEGFSIDPAEPHILLEQTAAATVLRVRLINHRLLLDKPRTLHFAVLPVPTKPLPADARTMQWDSNRMHVGGIGWWGTTGCFVFPQNDAEWQDWLAGKPFRYKGQETMGSFAFSPRMPRDSKGRLNFVKGREYGAYRAADLIGSLQPEFAVFAGEWVGQTNPPLAPDPSLLRLKNGDTPIWPEPEQRSIYLRDACIPSMYDFEAYQFYLMAKNTGVGGYWWDWNSFVEGNSLDKGTMYLDDAGQPRPRLNLFQVRAFYERIARIDQELGVPDTNNVYAPGAVYQMPWLTRINAWESLYLESDLDDMFSAHGLDKYRATIGKYSGIPVQLVMNIGLDLKQPRARSMFALALLHDNGIFGVDGNKPVMALLDRAGVLDPQRVWVPYWRSEKVVVAAPAGILVSAYADPASGRTTLVVVNPAATAATVNLSFPRDLVTASNAETGEALPIAGRALTGLSLKSHDFMLIQVQ